MNKDTQKIFEHLITLDESQQKEYIEENCANDPELKSVLKQLLETHNNLNTFDNDQVEAEMLGILAESTQSTLDLSSNDNNDQLSGEKPIFNGYQVIHKIDSGGMGDVYLCQPNNQDFSNQVAIKLLKAGFSAGQSKRRFLHEQKILSRLKHPNISTFIDASFTHNETPYVVMEYCEGDPITTFAKNNQMSIDDRIDIFLKLCDAVQYAHNNLIIHRDIKPSNILVTQESLKLLDFGISKDLDTEDKLTQTGLSAMTPAYASPEQLSGKPVALASDVYSLGVILYELMTETRPFSHAELTPAQYENAVNNTEPELASQRISSSKLSKELTGDLDLIIHKAIRGDTSERFNNVIELSDELKRYRAGMPIQTNKSGYPYYIKKFINRHKAAVIFGSISLISIISLLVFTVFQNIEITLQKDNAIQERNKAQVLSETFSLAFKNADPTQSFDKEVTAKDVLKQAQNLIQNKSNINDQTKAELILDITRTYLNTGNYNEALELLDDPSLNHSELTENDQVRYYSNKIRSLLSLQKRESAYEVFNQIPASLKSNEYIISASAYIDHSMGKYNEAEEKYKLLFNTSSPESDHYLLNCVNFVDALVSKVNIKEAIKIATDCLETSKVDVYDQKKRWELSMLYNELGHAYGYDKQYELSNEAYFKGLEIRKTIFDENHLFVTDMYNVIGINYSYLGDFDLALEYHLLALNGTVKHFGEGHPNTFMNLYNIGLAYDRNEDYETSEQYFLEIINHLDTPEKKESLNMGFVYHALGLNRVSLNKIDEAIESFEISTRIFTKAGSGFLINAGSSQVKLAEIYFNKGQYNLSRKYLDDLLPVIDDFKEHEQYPTYLDLRTKLADKI